MNILNCISADRTSPKRHGSRQPVVLPFIVFFISVAICSLVILKIDEHNLRTERAQLQNITRDHAVSLGNVIENALIATYTLATLVQQGEGEVRNFNTVGTQLIDLFPVLSTLQLAPDGITRHVVPIKGNEQLIGIDHLRDPVHSKESIFARETGKLTLAEPLSLLQGGTGVVGRMPVFLRDKRNPSRQVFWGFTVAQLKLSDILRKADLKKLESHGLSYEVSRIDPNTIKKQILAASSPPIRGEMVSELIPLPNATWTISVAPVQGFGERKITALYVMVAFVFSLTAAYFVYLTMRLKEHKKKLEKQVDLRTRELSREMNEHKRAELALRESEERFRTFVEKSPLGIALIGVEGRYEYVNPAFVAISGYDLSDLKTGRDWFLKAYPDPDYREEALKIWKSDLKRCGTSEVRPRIFDVVRKDGESRAILFRPVTLSSGEQFVMYEDVTDHKRSEQEMALLADIGQVIGSTLQIDEVYENLAQQIRRLIPFDSMNVNLCDGQQEMMQVMYASGKKMPGRMVGDKYPIKGALVEIGMRTRRGILATSATQEGLVKQFPGLVFSTRMGMLSMISVPLIARDRIIGNLSMRAERPFAFTEKDLGLTEKIGMQIAGAIANAQLFAELKGAEESLQKQKRNLDVIVASSPVGMLVLDERNSVMLVNEAAEIIAGATSEEMISRQPGNALGCTHSTKDPRGCGFAPECPLCPLRNAILSVVTGDHVRNKELPLDLTRSGATKTVWLIVSAESFTIDNQLRIVIALDEITQRKQAEREKQELQERLNRSEKMEALGHLAGGVAHDLNNVIGVTMGYAELLHDGTPEGNHHKKYARGILSSIEKAAAMIQDLLTMARRGVSVSEVVDLNRLLSNVLKSAEYNVMRDFHPSVVFRTEICAESLPISGSEVHLEKTVFNLLSNAAESISGSGMVTVRTERQYLDKPVHGYDEVKEGDYAVLMVEDTGGGISKEDLSRIFEPFFTKKKMGRSGTGLGLAIVWGTVKDHEGYVDVESETEKGTTFTLYFPLTKEKKAKEGETIPVERYMGQGESVLVVDDVAGQREIAEGLLTQLSYRVTTVSNGEEAIKYLEEHKADIVILDMIMEPGIDGLETYRRITQTNPTQKAIIISGFSETDRVKEARALGAGAYIRKPYNREKIGIAIRKELERV